MASVCEQNPDLDAVEFRLNGETNGLYSTSHYKYNVGELKSMLDEGGHTFADYLKFMGLQAQDFDTIGNAFNFFSPEFLSARLSQDFIERDKKLLIKSVTFKKETMPAGISDETGVTIDRETSNALIVDVKTHRRS
ncbi:MAG: hypothetical protein O3C63_04080 [Cyanobacteria bacterium]|nr:hypothetical protein [Cyanobacteriota bacterium]MDA1021648.1 hypothetical protein [Cyanobacteriota bacterium]